MTDQPDPLPPFRPWFAIVFAAILALLWMAAQRHHLHPAPDIQWPGYQRECAP